jgi:hypothetical protein
MIEYNSNTDKIFISGDDLDYSAIAKAMKVNKVDENQYLKEIYQIASPELKELMKKYGEAKNNKILFDRELSKQYGNYLGDLRSISKEHFEKREKLQSIWTEQREKMLSKLDKEVEKIGSFNKLNPAAYKQFGQKDSNLESWLQRFVPNTNKAKICEECYRKIQNFKPRTWEEDYFSNNEVCQACGKKQKEDAPSFI